jgi:transcriptional regulator, XRE family
MTLQEYKNKKMQEPKFADAYKEVQSEMDIIRASIDDARKAKRFSQNNHQKRPKLITLRLVNPKKAQKLRILNK